MDKSMATTSDTTLRSYTVIMPAYNEESSIKAALDSISEADKHTSYTLDAIIVCINGCTDATESIVRNWDTLPVVIIYSKPGYLSAMNKLLAYTRKHHGSSPMLKLDADSVVEPHCIQRLLSELDAHPELKLAGGHPLPSKLSNHPLHQRLLGRILSLRSIYPLAERAVHDVEEYHPFALADPQAGIGNIETKLKIYFHGRVWCARQPSMIPLLHSTVLGDDVFLNDWLYTKYGPTALRVIYGANVYFKPNYSLVRHWKVYKRIYEDKERVRILPSYEILHQMRKTHLGWSYIVTRVPFYDAILFSIYGVIRFIEEKSFAHTVYKLSYWQYEEKES